MIRQVWAVCELWNMGTGQVFKPVAAFATSEEAHTWARKYRVNHSWRVEARQAYVADGVAHIIDRSINFG